MEIRFSGKNISVTKGMRDHLGEKLIRLEKYVPRLVESYVVVKKEKYLYGVEITALAKNLRAFGKGTAKDNVYTAMDQAYDRVEKQMKKFREKLKDHKKKKGKLVLAPSEEPAQEMMPSAEETPEVIRMKGLEPKLMSTDEASLQLKFSPSNFLVFLNAQTKNLSVIFKRSDGRYGLIEPEL